MSDTDDIKEKPVSDFPGWTKIQMGSSRRYLSPGGLQVSARRFMELAAKYRGQSYIPESDIPGPSVAPKRGFISTRPSGSSHEPTSNIGSDQNTTDSDQNEPTLEDIATDIKPRHSKPAPKSKHPRASAAALAFGFKKLLMLFTTAIMVRVMSDGRAAMTEQEATILGTALGNLLEPTKFNDEFGWLVAETGDWQAIGYILVTYASRLNDIVQEKKNAQRTGTAGPVPTNTSPGVSTAAGGNATGNGHQPAALPYSGQGPRWFTQAPGNGS